MSALAQNGLIGLLVIMVGMIKIPKIELNIWTMIARAIGRALNEEMVSRMDDLNKKLETHIQNTKMEYTRQARQRILLFSDEVLIGRGHSKEHYNEILEDIDKYEKYCESHPEFVNNKAVIAIETIKDSYQDCIENKSFLAYVKKND